MNFSKLTDDQLLQLIQAALAEATSRGVAMSQAAKDVYVDAKEKARIQFEAQQRELDRAAERERIRLQEKAQENARAAIALKEQQEAAAKLAASWSKKKAIFVALEEWGLKEDWQINVWVRDTDKRVYLDGVRSHLCES